MYERDRTTESSMPTRFRPPSASESCDWMSSRLGATGVGSGVTSGVGSGVGSWVGSAVGSGGGGGGSVGSGGGGGGGGVVGAGGGGAEPWPPKSLVQYQP